MAAPGVYLTDPDAMIVLPRGPRWESEDEFVKDADILNETIRGVIKANKMFRRKEPIFTFRIPKELIPQYFTWFELVGGSLRPFYYVFDSAIPSVKLYCRWWTPWEPKFHAPGNWEGTMQRLYDLTVQLKEEIAPVDILV